MCILIILRNQANVNLFRDFLVDSIDTGVGNEAIICSGFFQENFRKSAYRASMEKNLTQVLANNNVHTTIVGVHSYSWKTSFSNFVSSLQAGGVNVTQINKTNKRWHAKIFILKSKGKGVFGIIGSSNFTRPAFSVNQKFNVECDVILWENKMKKFTNLVKRTLSKYSNSDNNMYDYILAPYYEQMNNNISIEERLRRLEKEILNVD